MGVRIIRTKKPDKVLRQMRDALAPYVDKHADADIQLYRTNPVSVRIRIIDPDFRVR